MQAALAEGARGRGVDGARIAARPGAGSRNQPGLHAVGIRKTRDAQLYVPQAAADSDQAAPFLVYLHGAGGSEKQGINKLRKFADTMGFVLLSPASTGRTWDAIRGPFGPDVRALDKALARAFELCQVDAARVGLCGFSDGASYALGLGLANGELFRSVMAFSPGFIPAPFEASGRPKLFLSHGVRDDVLPIDSCSRRLAPELKERGYAVTYIEFDGPHMVPEDTAGRALRWFLE